ncbi:alpha-glucosidase [Phyllosticta citribraziliensis]|uniref:alpha-glucosidase n=1 Tax=Phyllosticta citribraziliensis TaxID=989973 RepID=A0ABR1MC07_9PEZI
MTPLLRFFAAGVVLTAIEAVRVQAQSLASAEQSMGVSESFTVITSPTAASTSYAPRFTVPADADTGAPLIANIDDSEAVDAQDVCPGYKASHVRRNAYGFTATLSLAEKEGCNVYGTDVEVLNLTVQYQNADRLSINISPANIDPSNSSWYILPEELVPRPALDKDANATIEKNDLQVSWSNEPSFSFKVIRRSTGDVLFDTTGSKLVYENQFIEFKTALPEGYNLYGLGERIHGLRLNRNLTATIYAVDIANPIDSNSYGSHPYYVDTRYFEVADNGSLVLVKDASSANASGDYVSYTHGVFLRNAHGQEVVLKEDGLTWRLLGGSIDLFFLAGPTAAAVTQQYQQGIVGLPAMQQYFTFGYHQCRWGYANWSQLEEVVDAFERFEIPLENIWTDIDYMEGYRDFTTDHIAYPAEDGRRFLEKVHGKGLHYIPIVDSAIYIPNPDNASDAYATYDRGNAVGAFLNNPDGSQYIGSVWPGYTVFPDWQVDTAVPWWSDELVRWHKKIPFDGIWIDMSEVSSFCVGSCGSNNLSLNPVHAAFSLPGSPGNLIVDYPEGFNVTNATEAAVASSASSSQAAATATAGSSSVVNYLRATPTPGTRNVDHPPYVIDNVQGDLGVHAVSPNATHFNGVQEYDVHNLFGLQILNATYHGLLEVHPGKRPFIIGRSTFAGSGRQAGHWGGDNYSRFSYMYFGIPQALTFALYGTPMFGTDTCGFNGNSGLDLCARWMQLNAFMPFYRNHNVYAAVPQEPYRWATVAEASRRAMAIRYALLPYMYSLFRAAHANGDTVLRALAWEFSADPTLAAVDTQFLLGPAVMVVPVLAPNANQTAGVFPGVAQGTRWFDWYSGTEVVAEPGQNKTLDAPTTHIPVFVRGGHVLPLQEPLMTTAAARQSPWSLLIALDSSGEARGSLYLDDGESVVQNATLNVEFVVTEGRLSASAIGEWQDKNVLKEVKVWGLQQEPETVKFGGTALEDDAKTWDKESGVLILSGLSDVMGNGTTAWEKDWELSWK